MKKKNDFIKGMTKDKLAEVGRSASNSINEKPAKTEKRKMFRFGEKAHALAKRIAVLEDKTIQDYIDGLVIEDAKNRYPDMYQNMYPKDLL